MIVVTMDTENFSWLALGEDESHARLTMAEAIRNHADQMPEGAWDDMSPSTVMEYYGARFHELRPGDAMRDDSLIASAVPYDRKEVA